MGRIKPSVSGVLAATALFLVLAGGGAYAAEQYVITSTNQIAPSVLAKLHGHKSKLGLRGPRGDRGPAGATGAQGPAGQQGSQGSQGSQGNQGAARSAGAAGAQGRHRRPGPDRRHRRAGRPRSPGRPRSRRATPVSRARRATPARRAHGATAPASPGANALFTFGPYSASDDADSGTCGNNWATDAYNRTYQVDPQSNGDFDVEMYVSGTFTTQAGDAPGACDGGGSNNGDTVAAGITGTFYGIEAFTLTGNHSGPNFVNDFDPTANCACSTDSLDAGNNLFFQAFFGVDEPSYTWEFYYTTPSNGSWTDTDHGSTGEIQDAAADGARD